MPLRLRKSLDQPYVVPADKRDLRWWLQQLSTRRGILAALALAGVAVALMVTARIGPFASSKLVPPVVTGLGDTAIRERVSGTPAVTTPPATKATPRRAAPASAVAAPRRAFESGLSAYNAAAYDDAARLLRLELARRGADSLAPGARTTAFMYLGAAELMLQRRDSANAAFRTLLANAPRHKVDSAAFPKLVTDFFEGVRRSLHGVARIAEIDNGVRVTVLAINPHHVSVDVHSDGGTKLVGLYDGPSADSLSVDWDERGADKQPVANGKYNIVVTARALDGKLLSVGRFPVVIDRSPEPSGSGR